LTGFMINRKKEIVTNMVTCGLCSVQVLLPDLGKLQISSHIDMLDFFHPLPPKPMDSVTPHRLKSVLACFVIWSVAQNAAAAPYLPASDAQVLERLPFKPNDPIAREMSMMRAELRRDPHNVDVAVRLASRYYSLVSEEGDPRFLGYAQAALAPWWDMPVPPVEVQVLRASLAQFRHDFEGALSDLTTVIERDPDHRQARLLRATIHIVQARYSDAKSDCRALLGGSDNFIAIGCEAMVDGLTGKAADAYQSLVDALNNHSQATPEEKLWVLTRLAEISQRQGRADVAEAHFKQALALGITDTFLLAAYSDFLLDQNRPAEVAAMLKDKTPSDALLLRLAFAERALNLPTAKQREAILAARFAAAQLRGDTVHQQEEARFALHVEKDPKKALTLAQENWKVQREPRDARIFLEAALALKDVTVAKPALQWIENSRIEDRTLTALARQLKGAGK
jgi:Tfp pilus assembly protein PilF